MKPARLNFVMRAIDDLQNVNNIVSTVNYWFSDHTDHKCFSYGDIGATHLQQCFFAFCKSSIDEFSTIFYMVQQSYLLPW
jgi:hypothetical protein